MQQNPSPELTAAAPDLLAALEKLLPYAARLIQGTTDGEPLLVEAREAIKQAKKG